MTGLTGSVLLNQNYASRAFAHITTGSFDLSANPDGSHLERLIVARWSIRADPSLCQPASLGLHV